jgi:hypothetical protein
MVRCRISYLLRTLVGYIFDAVIELWCVFCVVEIWSVFASAEKGAQANSTVTSSAIASWSSSWLVLSRHFIGWGRPHRLATRGLQTSARTGRPVSRIPSPSANSSEVCGTSPLPWSETNSRKSVGVSAVHCLHESIVINPAMEYGQWTTSISDNTTC